MNLDFFASETLYSGNAGLSTKTFWKREKKLNETKQSFDHTDIFLPIEPLVLFGVFF